ncbi:hypothetical protein RFI_08264 [Reticulomyxa filosa]|uniref:Uncharacterized protein n=1 Tax=Reticulomyxa filosa TaxID=46433 RepID=X6NSC4_RETFI|nr:hypothetical protein RFI_08264 [Reticulomyxa filosa]|eukprot:ETO28866.1 hypothetical protein RFI_08264 [Reticulomyxa filosa]
MTGGLDKTLQLFQMTGSKNVLLKRVFLQDLPIRCAQFTADGKEIIISGRRPYFYVFGLKDFQCKKIDQLIGRDESSLEKFWISPNNQHIVFLGNRGHLIVVSRKTKCPIKTLHLSDGISDCKFNKNGSRMHCLTIYNKIYTFDMTSFACIDMIVCDGMVNGTCLDVASPQNLFALGCNSGVVSVFQKDIVAKGKDGTQVMTNASQTQTVSGMTKALYSVNNLTTTINGVKFNHDGQLLAIWSVNKRLAVRLVHVSTGKVFQKWPTNERFRRVCKCTFSPNSGFLAIGTDSGYVHLIVQKHVFICVEQICSTMWLIKLRLQNFLNLIQSFSSFEITLKAFRKCYLNFLLFDKEYLVCKNSIQTNKKKC